MIDVRQEDKNLSWIEIFLYFKKLCILIGCRIKFVLSLNYYKSEILFHYLNLRVLKNEI